MKQLLIVAFLSILSHYSHAQADSLPPVKKEIKRIPFDDSSLKKLEHFRDSVAANYPPVNDSQVQEDISRNMDGIIALQNEQVERKKNSAIVRIAIGLALLVVLIIGLRRKGKK